MIFVSVVMAVYNGETYLQEAIDSVLQQTYKNLELVIVNDGSTDNTKNILDNIMDHRVQTIHLKENKGAANALNTAIKHSSGSWIAIQDADDLSLPTRIENQIQYIIKHKQENIKAVGTLIECISDDPKIRKKRLRKEEKVINEKITAEQIEQFIYYGNPICHGTMMFAKSIWEKVGLYHTDYTIAYDYDLWLRILEETKITKVPKVLYKWRIDKNSLSRLDVGKTCNEVIEISTKAIERKMKRTHRSPKFCIISNKKGYKNFKSRILPKVNLLVENYKVDPSNKELNDICKQVVEKDIHGIIVLDHVNLQEQLQVFEKYGLELNEQYFTIWNVL